MPDNLCYKILKAHLQDGDLREGEEIGIKIDQTLTQDATGTMAYLQFESMNISKVKTELSVSYVDHNTLQDGFENADDHVYLKDVAAKYGVLYSKAGNGICHQVHLERFGKPGLTLLGSDSHTPTGGGIGMIAIGAGGLDIAVAMAGGPFYLTCPKVIKINLIGKLSPWVAAKDIILTVLKMLTTKGNVGCVVEYSGAGVKTLSVPERATITNMGAELGVTTSLFPSDEITKDFLLAQGRGEDFTELSADDDAQYYKVIDLDLSKIVPMVACPHSPDNVVEVNELKGKKIDQILIGSCTNSSYRDWIITASMLKGKKVSEEVSFGMAPGSKQVLQMISESVHLSDIIKSGARILEATCGFCIGNGQAPKTNSISVRTNNRNFFGRSGTKSAGIYLVSTETAVACALKGEFFDPRDLEMEYPDFQMPHKFLIDDSMILKPSENPENIKISRGPNIGDPLQIEKPTGNIAGAVLIKVGDKITTDHIMPAGARLKYRSNIPKYATYVFETLDEHFASKALMNKSKGVDNIIVASESYGQGSSREHAAICPKYLGISVLLAKSAERIHTANLINFGIFPLFFVNQEDYENIDMEDVIEIENIFSYIDNSENVLAKNITKNSELKLAYKLSNRQIDILKAGGLLNYMSS
ncbi:MAG: aconitate hydratase [Pseudomonadota bacterium]